MPAGTGSASDEGVPIGEATDRRRRASGWRRSRSPRPAPTRSWSRCWLYRSIRRTGAPCAPSPSSPASPRAWCAPSTEILGADVAGRVEAVGSGVARLEPGDEVYGDLLDHGFGAFAEYVSVPIDALAPKPTNLSFEEAAAVPVAGVTALQGLGRLGEIRPGQKLVVNGASGGVGTFAVQIAKSFRARDRRDERRNIDLVRLSVPIRWSTTPRPTSLAVGPTTSSSTRSGIDRWPTSDRPLPRAARPPSSDSPPWRSCSRRFARGQGHRHGVGATADDLGGSFGADRGRGVRPQIDRRYGFAEIPAAIAYLEEGHARGRSRGRGGGAEPTAYVYQ